MRQMYSLNQLVTGALRLFLNHQFWL